MMGWYGGGMGPLGWVATGVSWVLLLGLIVWLIARLLPSSIKTTGPEELDSARREVEP
jgi:hypothetical protein